MSSKNERDGFSHGVYRTHLLNALSRFEFVNYESWQIGNPFVLWRHDVDLSLNRALRLAEIENEFGVSSTFFLNLHSRFYNLLEADQTTLARTLIKLGHEVGLHFDASFYARDDFSGLEKRMELEANLVQNVLDVEVRAVSFHNPSPAILSWGRESLAGMVNAYSRSLREHVPYCSDSGGTWRYQTLHSFLSDPHVSCAQVLTHPGWWHETHLSPQQSIRRAIEGRSAAANDGYLRTRRETGSLRETTDRDQSGSS